MSEERSSYTLILTATVTVDGSLEPVEYEGRVFAFRKAGTEVYFEPHLKITRFVGVDDGPGKVLREKEARDVGIAAMETAVWLLPGTPPLQRPRSDPKA
jgi:hypothetical protein